MDKKNTIINKIKKIPLAATLTVAMLGGLIAYSGTVVIGATPTWTDLPSGSEIADEKVTVTSNGHLVFNGSDGQVIDLDAQELKQLAEAVNYLNDLSANVVNNEIVLKNEVESKQDVLTAGTGITLNESTIGADIGTGTGQVASGDHTHDLLIESSAGTSLISLLPNTKYQLTAGGQTYVFTTPADTTYSSLPAASNGADVSLVTTGEKDSWNKKSELALGTTATTAAKGDHTHSLTIASETTGESSISLLPNTKYKITAGGQSFVFTTPAQATPNDATLTIQQNSEEIGTFTANASADSEVNITTDEWTETSTVQSDGKTVAFTGLSENFAYDLYIENKLATISALTQTGEGDNVTLTYSLNGAEEGDICKLRIIK